MSASGSRSFQVHACLGKGGFGEVYKATMVQASGVRREVVLKVLRPGLDPAGQAVERLRDEGRLLATLQHPVIMRAFDVTELQGRVALVAEYIDGQDLGETFVGDAPIPPRGLVQAIGAVSGALQAAWNAPGEGGQPMRLVHRDIKPSNIRIGRHGEVKLLDFGIAKADAMGREAQTATNMMIGSIGYMAPERFMSSDVHPASDVFALGVCMYEGLARKGLFRHLTPPMAARLSVDTKAYEEAIREAFEALPQLPPPLLALLGSTLAHGMGDRPTAQELHLSCDELADGLPGGSITRWASKRTWPEPADEGGPLVGQRIVQSASEVATSAEQPVPEATAPAPAKAPDPPPVPQETRWVRNDTPADGSSPEPTMPRREPTDPNWNTPSRRPLAAVGALVGLAGMFGLILLIVGGLVWFSSGLPEEAADPSPALAAPSEPALDEPADDQPSEREAVAEEQEEVDGTVDAAAPPSLPPAPAVPNEPMPRAVAPSTEPVSQPSPAPAEDPWGAAAAPEPAPSEPAPTASTAPQPVAAPARGTVRSNGKGVLLKNATGSYPPGDVPAGDYTVFAQFGDEPVEAGNVTVEAGKEVVLSCNAILQKCTAS